jgi:hypothetical protein
MEKSFKSILTAVLLIGVAATFMSQALTRLPIDAAQIAIDWKKIWSATHGFSASFGSSGLFNPPWVLPLIWPFTVFSFEISWGLVAVGTLTVLIASVPRMKDTKNWVIAILILALSYPSLRQIVDGNLEAITILGVLILFSALRTQNELLLAVGLLLSSGKIQSSWFVILGLAIWLYRGWPKEKVLRVIGWSALLALPFLLWRGAEWFTAILEIPQPSEVSSSLNASLARHSVPAPAIWVIWLTVFLISLRTVLKKDWIFSPTTVGMLSSTSLLLAPYAASNSVLSPLSLGVIPLWLTNRMLGGAALILFNLPYLAVTNPDLRIAWESSYWTGVLLIMWIVFLNAGKAQNRS